MQILCIQNCASIIFYQIQMFNGSIAEAIHNLPAELRETIYKEYLTLKIKQRSCLGFDEVHDELKSAPFCQKNEQITKIMACRNCNSCRINDLCYLCFKNGEKHFLGYPVFDIDDLDESPFVFLKYIWSAVAGQFWEKQEVFVILYKAPTIQTKGLWDGKNMEPIYLFGYFGL